MSYVTLAKLSRPFPTLSKISIGIGNTIAGVDRTLKELLEELASSDEIQASPDGRNHALETRDGGCFSCQSSLKCERLLEFSLTLLYMPVLCSNLALFSSPISLSPTGLGEAAVL
ncbi:hypothetical protein U1Q18_005135 [Sarracenia purpurea var. burkii]